MSAHVMTPLLVGRRTKRAALGLGLVLATTPVIAAPSKALPASFAWSADCTELAAGGSIPLANARRYVPAEYHIIGEENGAALLNVGIGRCTHMFVDGEPVKDAFTGFVAVFIEAPDGGGIGRYFLWSNGSSKVVDQRLRSLGMPSIVSKGMRLEIEGSPPVVSAEGTVPRVDGDQGGYGSAMVSAPTTPGPGQPFPTSYWHVGSRGLVKAAFNVALEEEPAGPAVIRAESGTVMSKLIGGEQLDGGALLARFHFDASIGLVAGES